MYGMRTIIAHQYGVTFKVDYACVWGALTGPLQTDIAPVVEELINEQETKEESKE